MSNNIENDHEPHTKETHGTDQYLQTHDSAQIDKYKKYLAHQGEPADNSRNPRNLFHDLNSVDMRWFKIARANLSRSR